MHKYKYIHILFICINIENIQERRESKQDGQTSIGNFINKFIINF